MSFLKATWHALIVYYFVMIIAAENKRWQKYLKKINSAVKDYKECKHDDCSCHSRYEFKYMYNVFSRSDFLNGKQDKCSKID